jgi:protocatechuate 3,4-dioxygenase beta subunit
MPQHRSASLAAAALFLFLPLSLAAAPIRISGRILSQETEKGLAGARVELRPAFEGYDDAVRRLAEKVEPAPLASTRTGGDGSFELIAPEGGFYEVVVRAEGLMAEKYPLPPLVEEVGLPPAFLGKPQPLDIQAVGPEGRPVPGIAVRVQSSIDDMVTWEPTDRHGVTGADGKVVLPRSPMPSRFAVTSPELLGPAVSESLRGDVKPVVLRVSSRRAGVFEVRDSGGKPVPGALVRWKSSPVAVTGADGRLRIAVPEEGLTVETRDGQGARIDPPASPGGRGVTIVRLERPRTILGKVVETASRRPIPDAVVWGGDSPIAPPVRTGADGEFRLVIPGFLPGARLQAVAAGYHPSPRQYAPAQATRPVELTLDRSASLSGIVVDPEGRPVAGATIEPSPGPKQPASTRWSPPSVFSGRDGRFVLTGLIPRGTYEVNVISEGFARTTVTARTAEPGKAIPEVRVVLDPGRVLSGRVVDEEGRPIAGAELALSMELWDRRRASSDETGRFVFKGLNPGIFSLLAKGKGHPQVHLPAVEIPTERKATDVGDVVLPDEVAIEGRVTDSRGRPLEGAEVKTHRSPGPLHRRELGRRPVFQIFPSATTGPDGTFRLGELKAGDALDLTVQHPDHVPARLPGVKAPTAEPLRIELRRGRSLSGRVVGPEGEPVAGATLSPSRGSMSRGNTDPEGAFRMSGIEPGSIDLGVAAKGYRPKVLEGIVIPEERDPENLEIVLDRSVSVEVRVLSMEGEPMAGEWVHANPEVPQDPREFRMFGMGPPQNRTDGRGIVKIEVPKPGRYRFSVSNGGPSTVVEVPPEGTSVELRVPPIVEISGRVLDENGEGVSGARVTLESSREGGGFSSISSSSDADGSFRFPGSQEGAWRLTAGKKGFADSPPQEIVVAGQSIHGIEIRLTRDPGHGKAAITGRLLGLAPEDLLHVQVGAAPGNPFQSKPGKVFPDGGYRIEDLESGEWEVNAATPSGARAQGKVQIAPGVPETVLDLEFGGLTLSGRVLVDGLPLAGAGVAAWVGPRNVAGQTRTDYTGAFTLPGLRRGIYRLVVQTRDGQSGLSDLRIVDLEEDRVVQVAIVTGRISGRIVSGATGAPLPEATVLLDSLHKEIDQIFSAPSARSGGDGIFQSSRLAAGTYRVTVRREGFAPEEGTVQLRPGEEATVEVVLKSQDAP